MPEITNCKISTERDYSNNDEVDQVHYIAIKIPIPGGEALYKIPSTKEINLNIEVASKLLAQTKGR